MNEKAIATINGYGQMLRFITPVLITVAILLLNWLRTDISELKVHFTNHLSHHNSLEIGYEGRISKVEVELKLRR